MKKHILLTTALISILSLTSYSQITFEKGYYINESDQRIECLIKNMDWINNPNEFEYRLSLNEPIQRATIQDVKEFGVNNAFKFIRAKVNIDKSSDQVSKLGTKRNPTFQEELIFLEVLIEGQASLYLYVNDDLTRFFYKFNDSDISQLVYRRYLFEDKISTNNYFKRQLSQHFKCDEIKLVHLESLRYIKRDLEKIFIKYHECTNSNYINYQLKQKRDFFNLNIRPGINYSSLEIENPPTRTRDIDFGNKIGFRLGLEAELILPFNKNKWSIVIEPTYQYFSSEQTRETSSVTGGILVSKVDYTSIELPIGLRHYFYFNDKSKLFANISFILDFDRSSKIEFSRQDNLMLSSLELQSGSNVALGIGYKFMNKYSLEMRYNTSRNILHDLGSWNSDYRTVSLIIGYSLF